VNKQFTETEIVSLSNLNVTSSGGGSQSASYSLESDGDIVSVSSLLGSIDQGDWISPKALAPSDYEVRASIVSGSLTSGTTGSWLALTSNRTWTVSRDTVGTSTCVFTVEIRKGSGSTLASATITLEAEVIDLGGL
jgi:hypothetical protein